MLRPLLHIRVFGLNFQSPIGVPRLIVIVSRSSAIASLFGDKFSGSSLSGCREFLRSQFGVNPILRSKIIGLNNTVRAINTIAPKSSNVTRKLVTRTSKTYGRYTHLRIVDPMLQVVPVLLAPRRYGYEMEEHHDDKTTKPGNSYNPMLCFAD